MLPQHDARLDWLSASIRREVERSRGVIPRANSEAAADEAYLKPFGALFQDLVTFRLRSTWDHLQALEILLRYSATAAPFAPYSVARAALVSAAIAHWLVTGDASQRRSAALQVHVYDLNRDLLFLQANLNDSVGRLSGQQQQIFRSAIALRNELLDVLHAERRQLAGARSDASQPGRNTRLDELALVAGAQHLFDEAEINPRLGVMYMRLSGVAHAMPWASNKNRQRLGDLPGGLERYVHVGDRGELIDCGWATAYIAIAAQKQFAQLCSD